MRVAAIVGGARLRLLGADGAKVPVERKGYLAAKARGEAQRVLGVEAPACYCYWSGSEVEGVWGPCRRESVRQPVGRRRVGDLDAHVVYVAKGQKAGRGFLSPSH